MRGDETGLFLLLSFFLLLLLLLDPVISISMEKTKAREISSKHPTYPITSFGDNGFEPHLTNFQASSEDRRKNKRETRFLGLLNSKQQKPISKDSSKKKSEKSKWWRNALIFWKWKNSKEEQEPHDLHHQPVESRPVYKVEPGSETPTRSGRPGSRPVAGSLTPSRKGDVETRYLSLRELNTKPQDRWISSSPIYLVT